MVILDCRGQQCPQPVVQVRRQMQADPDVPLRILVSDPAARDNGGRLAASQAYQFAVTDEHGLFRLDLIPAGRAEGQQAALSSGPTVILFASDQMGSGDPKLGEILMKNYLFTLAENNPAPDLLLFVNAGAKLTTAGADTIEPLAKLADRGADIATCGLCLEFFGLQESLAVGRVTNMLEIATAMQTSGRVIRP